MHAQWRRYSLSCSGSGPIIQSPGLAGGIYPAPQIFYKMCALQQAWVM